MTDRLFALRGGTGDRLLVLLHGMGANAEVWKPMLASVDRHWDGRWIAPDLRGHGRSVKTGPFSIARHAADVCALVEAEDAASILIVGHSFGAVVAATLGSGAHAITPDRVVGFSVKVDWADNDLDRMRSLADRPRQTFPTFAGAAERALAMAGLKGMATVESDVAAAGVVETPDGFAVALEPEIFRSVDARIGDAMRACRVPLRLGSGSLDPMAPVEPMRALDPAAVRFEGAGHNVQWEQPEAVWQFVLKA